MKQLEMFPHALEDEMHEAYGAMIHRGRVESGRVESEQVESAQVESARVESLTRPATFRPNTHAIARQLRNERVRQRIPQKVVAYQTGICATHLGKLETGVGTPTFARLLRWADALGYELKLVKKSPL
jgi:hypothetical protein